MPCGACSTVLRTSHSHLTFTYGLYYYYYRLHATIHGINTSVYSDPITTGSFFHFLYEPRTGDRLALYSFSSVFLPFILLFFFFTSFEIAGLRDSLLYHKAPPHAHGAGEPCRYHFLIPFLSDGICYLPSGLTRQRGIWDLREILVIGLNTCRTVHIASLCPAASDHETHI